MTAPDVFEMRYLHACPACGSERFVPFGHSIEVGAPHCAQSRCRDCKVVFSNPQCTPASLAAYYGQSYWQTHWSQHLSVDAGKAQDDLESQRPEAKRIRDAVVGGRVLEIGSGSGSLLAALREQGFDVYGLEPSTAAAERSRVCYGLDHIEVGTLEDRVTPDRPLPGAPFDAIVAWHVIEHVNDLPRFLGTVRSLLRVGGVLWLGTENYRNAGYGAAWIAQFVRGRPPPFATSGDHTFAFTYETLSAALRRSGFEVESIECYQDSWAEKNRHMKFKTPLSMGWFFAQHSVNALLRTGPFIRLAAKRS